MSTERRTARALPGLIVLMILLVALNYFLLRQEPQLWRAFSGVDSEIPSRRAVNQWSLLRLVVGVVLLPLSGLVVWWRACFTRAVRQWGPWNVARLPCWYGRNVCSPVVDVRLEQRAASSPLPGRVANDHHPEPQCSDLSLHRRIDRAGLVAPERPGGASLSRRPSDSHFCNADLTVTIDQTDVQRRRDPASYFGCGWFGRLVGPRVGHSGETIIAHELLGHAWAYATGGDPHDERIARGAENQFRGRDAGGTLRCN
jgi:hypothetical protein